MAYQQGVRGTGSLEGQKRDHRYSKRCLECEETYYKYVACSRKRWELSKFCSTSCKAKYMRLAGVLSQGFRVGHTPPHKGAGKPRACRGCGKPIKGTGTTWHCGAPECKAVSKTIHLRKIGLKISKYASRRGEGELTLEPYLLARGWMIQYPVTVEGRTFFLDFAKPEAKLYVEADGRAHQIFPKRDVERTQLLNNDGWMGLRFWNSEIRDNLPGVLSAIWH